MPRLVTLPTTDQPLLVETVTLEGKNYVLTFDWSSRINAWCIAIEDETGTTLTSGGLLTFGVDLFRHVASEARPGGRLVITTYPDATTPTLEGITEAEMLYFDTEELEAAGL